MQTPSNNEITINNLRLLGYDIQEANKAFRINLDSLSAESLSNPKLLVHIINFLLYKTVDQQSIDAHFKQLYPPRTQLEQTLYKQEVAEYLKNSRMVPRNFITSKTIIENKSLRFLRFLSEFALRNQFLQMFPQKQLKTVYTDPQKILQDDRISINDIGDIFSPASYQFEVFNKDSLNMPIQLIQMMNQICIQRTMVESKKLKKILRQNCSFIDEVSKITNLVSDTIKTEREKSLKLQQQIQSLKNIIKPQYLSQERKLDRKPQIDQSIKVFQGIQNIINQFYELRMDYGVTNIQSTPRLDRFDTENNLNTIVNQYNQNLEATEEKIIQIESQTWIQERASKALNNSRLTVQNIRKLKESIKIQ